MYIGEEVSVEFILTLLQLLHGLFEIQDTVLIRIVGERRFEIYKRRLGVVRRRLLRLYYSCSYTCGRAAAAGGGLRPNSIQFKLRMMVSKCRRILSSLCAVILSSVAAAFLPVKHTVLEPHGRPFSALHSIPADGKPCSKIEVCWSSSSKDCKRRGSKKTYDLFMELGTGLEGVEIVAADCMDECTSGPNVRFDDDDRRILGASGDPPGRCYSWRGRS